jgi:hypothetical protein
MGNNPSRVAPVHSLKIFDSQTRARYKNQRESNQLRLRIRRLDVRENEVLSRLTYEQHDAKMKLHELQYDKAQRQLYKSIDTRM